MSLRHRLAQLSYVRALALPLLRRLDRDITVTHDLTGRPLHLRSFAHKGYWYYGARREPHEIDRLRTLIQPGDTVLEIGGHIGYLTQFFEDLVGDSGQVVVAEPAAANLRFLVRNVSDRVTVLPLAFSEGPGTRILFQEGHGGFTNALDRVFFDQYQTSLAEQRGHSAAVTETPVPTDSIDHYCASTGLRPTVLKIDVEGHELSVLKGAVATLSGVRCLMIEIRRQKQAALDVLQASGFQLSTPDGTPVTGRRDFHGNVFCTRHAANEEVVP